MTKSCNLYKSELLRDARETEKPHADAGTQVKLLENTKIKNNIFAEIP